MRNKIKRPVKTVFSGIIKRGVIMTKWEYTETELWRYNQGDISIMHVFSVISFKNNVIAFCEARFGEGSDADDAHDIYMKKSTDGGKTFETNRVLLDSRGEICYVNPTPIYDRVNGRLFLFYAINLGNSKTSNYYIYSDDCGQNWSDPQDISDILQKGGMHFNIPGPGHAIQLKNGRLIVQFWHRKYGVEVESDKRGYCVSLLYSDDCGKTWQHNGYFGQNCTANESRITETEEYLLWNVRSLQHDRYQSRSFDGGITWSEFEKSNIPTARRCDSSTITLSDGKTVIFSHVSRLDARRDMEILISYDCGKTYPDSFKLMQGDAMPGYSDLCMIDDVTVGLLHARNNHVLFSRISLETLTGGKYDGVTRSVWLK